MLQEHDERESSHMGSAQWSAYTVARSDVWDMETFSFGALPVLGSHGQAFPKTGTVQTHPGSWGLLTLESVAASMPLASRCTNPCCSLLSSLQ